MLDSGTSGATGLACRDAHNLRCPQQQLIRLFARRRAANVVSRAADDLMQRPDFLVGDAGIPDLHKLEHGLRVDEREEADHIARAILSFESGEGGVFESGEGVHGGILLGCASRAFWVEFRSAKA